MDASCYTSNQCAVHGASNFPKLNDGVAAGLKCWCAASYPSHATATPSGISPSQRVSAAVIHHQRDRFTSGEVSGLGCAVSTKRNQLDAAITGVHLKCRAIGDGVNVLKDRADDRWIGEGFIGERLRAG